MQMNAPNDIDSDTFKYPQSRKEHKKLRDKKRHDRYGLKDMFKVRQIFLNEPMAEEQPSTYRPFKN